MTQMTKDDRRAPAPTSRGGAQGWAWTVRSSTSNTKSGNRFLRHQLD